MRDREYFNEEYNGSYEENRNPHSSGQNYNNYDSSNRLNPTSQYQTNAENGNQPLNTNDYSQYRPGTQNTHFNSQLHHQQPGYSSPQTNQHYDDYDRFRSERGRVGFSDFDRRGYNSHSMYAIPGPDPATGRRAYYPHANPEPYENHDRGLGSQFTDEVRSWFGDREASRRRQMDARQSMGDAWEGERRNRSLNNNNFEQDRPYSDDRDRDWVRNHNLNNGW